MATKMMAQGRLVKDVAKALHVTDRAVEYWRRDYPELWAGDFRKAMDEIMTAVRADQAKRLPPGEPEPIEEIVAVVPPAIEKIPDKPNKAHSFSLWGALELYEQHHPDSKPGSCNQMDMTVRRFERWAGRTLMLKDLTDSFVLGWMKSMLDGGSRPATVNGKRAMILALWRFARKHRLCKRGPHDCPKVKDLPRMPEAWTVEEVGRVLQVARGIDADPPWKYRRKSKGPNVPDGISEAAWWESLFLVCYDTGQRIGAILQLRPQDIDLDRGLIVFPADVQKTGRPKLCRIHAETVAACRKIWDSQRRLMFPWEKTRNWLNRAASHIMEKAAIRFGRDKGGIFHKFRRTAGTLIEANGGDGARFIGNTRGVFERHYHDPRADTGAVLSLLPRPQVKEAQP
jgi:integrase